MKIEITRATSEQLKKKPAPGAGVGFGQIFTDHMFLMDYEEGKGWLNPRIQPYGPLSLDPAALVFHYGQEVFEGLKAYRWQDGDIYLFRPRLNYERLNRSARTLCMPAVDVEDMLEATRKLVWLERDWVPSEPGISLSVVGRRRASIRYVRQYCKGAARRRCRGYGQRDPACRIIHNR